MAAISSLLGEIRFFRLSVQTQRRPDGVDLCGGLNDGVHELRPGRHVLTESRDHDIREARPALDSEDVCRLPQGSRYPSCDSDCGITGNFASFTLCNNPCGVGTRSEYYTFTPYARCAQFVMKNINASIS